MSNPRSNERRCATCLRVLQRGTYCQKGRGCRTAKAMQTALDARLRAARPKWRVRCGVLDEEPTGETR